MDPSSPTSAESETPSPSVETDDGTVLSTQVPQIPTQPQDNPPIGPIEEIVSDRAGERPRRSQGDLPEQGTEKVPSASKGKAKEVCCSPSGRNICVSSDGTLGAFGKKNSNVVELQSRIIKDDKQSSYYISGIGTYGESDVRRWWDAAVASSFERNVLKAYKWLCDTYQPGDRIFLFGFSRGAYQVRVIAGMIQLVGLLYRGNHAQIPSAFKLYMQIMKDSQKKSDSRMDAKKGRNTKKETDMKEQQKSMDKQKVEREQKVMDRRGQDASQTQDTKKKTSVEDQCKIFKKAFSQPNVKVHFVGAWDTVSSVGIVRRPCLPATTSGMGHVCHFRQALALDERRVKFWPEYAKTYASSFGSPTSDGGDVKEVWFAGSHSDIGGWSHPNENLDSFGPALRWMTYEAMNHGLRMLPHTKLWEHPVTKPTLTGGWHILEYLPLRRPSNIEATTRRLHMGAPRHIQRTQFIHESVFEDMGFNVNAILNNSTNNTAPSGSDETRPTNDNGQSGQLVPSKFGAKHRISSAVAWVIHRMWRSTPNRSDNDGHTKYKPSARFYDRNATWDDVEHLVKERMEGDPFASVDSAMQKLADAVKLSESDQGGYNAAIIVLKNHVSSNRADGRSLVPFSEDQVSKALAEVPSASLILLSALEQATKQADQKRVENMTVLFAALGIFSSTPKIDLRAFTVLSNIAQVVRGDETWRSSFREAVRRHVHGPLSEILGVTNGWRVRHIAFTGNNEDSLLVGAIDFMVTWNTQAVTKSPVVHFDGTDSGIASVAISRDGSRYATGLYDGSVRLRNIETGFRRTLMAPKSEDAERVFAVALSDSNKIAFGSERGVITTWDIDAEAHTEMIGHKGEINRLAFSPDESQLASGADDLTIRLWDTSNGQQMKVFRGHTGLVWFVAFSTCGNQIVSASADWTVCLWDVASGDLKKKLEGHNGEVSCAIFSPNGRFIASGSHDETVQVWDSISGDSLVVYDVDDWVYSLAFSADGNKLVSGTDDGNIHIWDTSFLI